jgi:hypothetical protein
MPGLAGVRKTASSTVNVEARGNGAAEEEEHK